MKRIGALILSLMLLLCGCSKEASDAEVIQQAAGTEQAAAAEEEQAYSQGIHLLGFVVKDDGSMSTYMMMHGFLSTAENLGYPGKLYRITSDAMQSVKEAEQDGCAGLLIPAEYTEAIAAARAAGMYVVVPYDACTGEADVNVVCDNSVYIEELARGIAERMTERSLKSGRLMVYGSEPSSCYKEFQAAIAEYYPQYTTVEFRRTPGISDEMAVEELAEFILNNRDIKGMYACDTKAAPIAVKAREKAISDFKKMTSEEEDGKKAKATPEPTLAPGASPTPNPALLKQISITAFGCGISEENLALFNDNDIYALCIEPYYEAAATAAMMLDRLINGEETAKLVSVNRPIAYADTIDKYLAIYNEVKELFKVNEG